MTLRTNRSVAAHGQAMALALFALAARPAASQEPTFHADTRLVVVHITVRDHRGGMVTDLDRAAFTIYENGKRQPVALFRRDDIPVSLGIVIDNSGSMRARRVKVEAAALAFTRSSNPLDEMFVVNFADTPRLDVPITSDAARVEAGIARIDSVGGTALRDAVQMAAAYLMEHATRERKALLLITDGDDNASAVPAERIRRQLDQTGIAIYALGLPHDNPSKAQRARQELDELTELTGGVACHPGSLDDIDQTAVRLATQIRRQYTLAYTPLNQVLDGSYRAIRVAVSTPRGLSARTRAGYYATSGRSP